MIIPLARIHHLEQAIRRRRRLAIVYHGKRNHATHPTWREVYASLYWIQMDRLSALYQALYRSRSVYHHNATKLDEAYEDMMREWQRKHDMESTKVKP